MYRKNLFVLIAAVMLFLITSRAEAKGGFYMGLGAPYSTILGDFDGRSAWGGEKRSSSDRDNVGTDVPVGKE
jgi:hypothetical protein